MTDNERFLWLWGSNVNCGKKLLPPVLFLEKKSHWVFYITLALLSKTDMWLEQIITKQKVDGRTKEVKICMCFWQLY